MVDQLVKQALLVVDLHVLHLEVGEVVLGHHVGLLDLLVVSHLVGSLVVLEGFFQVHQYCIPAFLLAFDLDVDSQHRCVRHPLPSKASGSVETLAIRAVLSELLSCT